MTRKRVKLALFATRSERHASFQKRKKCIVKKLEEVTTLCDVDACAIISNPFEANIEVWPSHEGLHRVLGRFRDMSPTEQKKMYNQEMFTREQIEKTSEQLRILRIENQRSKMDQIINQYLTTGNLDYQNNLQLLNDIDLALRQHLQEVNMRIQSLKDGNHVQEPDTCGVENGEGSKIGGNMTNVANFMESVGVEEEPIFPNDDLPK